MIYRYLHDTEVLDTCSFLDPRVKSLPYLSQEERSIVKDLVIDRCAGAAGRFAGPAQSVPAVEVQLPVAAVEVISSAPLTGLLGAMFSQPANPDPVRNAERAAHDLVVDEVRRYLNTTLCSMSDSPLLW